MPEPYSAEFSAVMKVVLTHEGVHSDDPDDAGLDTWYGIARADHPNIPWPPTVAQALEIYWQEYWLKNHIEQLPAAVAGKVFDTLINLGPKPTIECLQRACVTCGAEIQCDGAIGEATIAACKAYSAVWLLVEFKHQAAAHYRAIAAANAYDTKFIHGWLDRVYGDA